MSGAYRALETNVMRISEIDCEETFELELSNLLNAYIEAEKEEEVKHMIAISDTKHKWARCYQKRHFTGGLHRERSKLALLARSMAQSCKEIDATENRPRALLKKTWDAY